jgi:hypothetical protein
MRGSVLALRLVYVGSALLSMAAAVLVTASLFIASRASQSTKILGISLVVSGVFVGVGVVLFGIQRQVAAAVEALRDPGAGSVGRAAEQLRRLAAYLLAAGAFVGVVLALLNYAILARIDQGFAVFG